MPRSRRTFSATTRQVCRLLGLEIARARRERRWTQAELAERVGVSDTTVRSIERGDPRVGLGVAVEAATLLGIELVADPDELPRQLSASQRSLHLLPGRVRHAAVDDDF